MVVDRVLPVSHVAVRAVVCDISTIADSELKALEVQVEPETAERGTYWVRGSFAGVPWSGRFAYFRHEHGFHSVNIEPRRFDVDISGGFIVTPAADPGRCRLRHYEQYLLPWRLVVLKPVIVAYLRWSMGPELARITEMARRVPAAG